MEYLVTVLVNVMPFVALAAVGIILVWQHRTLATVLVALGFIACALSQIASNVLGFYAFFGGPEEFVAQINRLAWIPPLAHLGIVGGSWIGSLALLWHTTLQAQRRI
jgi:hypothetical protein